MQVRLLGPVEIVGPDQASRPVSGLRRKAVLAVLALRAGEIVSAGRIIETVWGRDAATSVNTLQPGNRPSGTRTATGPRSCMLFSTRMCSACWRPTHAPATTCASSTAFAKLSRPADGT